MSGPTMRDAYVLFAAMAVALVAWVIDPTSLFAYIAYAVFGIVWLYSVVKLVIAGRR